MSSGLPVWVKPGSLDTDSVELADALRLGATGFWLDERLFATADPDSVLQALRTLVHVPAAV